MARTNRNYESIYDGNAARKVAVRETPEVQERRQRRNNVVALTEKELRASRRKAVNPMKTAATLVAVVIGFVMVAGVVAGQVQLTELTQEIETAQTELQQLQSVQIQLEMEAAGSANSAEIEEYAKSVLGMTKITNDQVTYISLAGEDQGVVTEANNGNGIFARLWHSISTWLA